LYFALPFRFCPLFLFFVLYFCLHFSSTCFYICFGFTCLPPPSPVSSNCQLLFTHLLLLVFLFIAFKPVHSIFIFSPRLDLLPLPQLTNLTYLPT
jgi:hypothetical protein